MSYRMDSDIVVPHGLVRQRPVPVSFKDYPSIVNRKDMVAVWMVSDCHTTSLREWYVGQLQKYINVDMWGDCSLVQCSRNFDDHCIEEHASKYKFVLAFENDFCKDYITEKLFKFLSRDIVVVARGSNEYFKHLPAEIFINVNNFPSPKALAKELLSIHNNNEKYISFLQEKDNYMVMYDDHMIQKPEGSIRHGYFFDSVPMCQLCQRLWNLDRHRKRIDDIYGDWFANRQCHSPLDLEFLKKNVSLVIDPFLTEYNELEKNRIRVKARLDRIFNEKEKKRLEDLKKKKEEEKQGFIEKYLNKLPKFGG